MKTQNFGTSKDDRDVDVYDALDFFSIDPSDLRACAQADYVERRMNFCGAKNGYTGMPKDGKYTMIKDGVKEGDRYVWECRYDEGPGDKKWMEKQDKIYIAQLKEKSKNNKLTKQEQQDLIEGEKKGLIEKEEKIEKDENKKNEFFYEKKEEKTLNQGFSF